MEKKGIHLYIDIKNIMDIIKKEESKDEDLKRTLHMLHTFFVGHTYLVKKFNAKIEKYTGSRSHIIIECGDKSDIDYESILKLVVANFIYNNEIFNNIPKYSQYSDFCINAGMDYGDYFEYDIDDGINLNEHTSIGGVANNSAKIQSFAPKDYIYVTQRFLDILPSNLRETFVELTEAEKENFSEKLKGKHIFKVYYKKLFDQQSLDELEESLSDIKDRINTESTNFNIRDIEFENVRKKLSFDNLSLKGKNKHFEGGVLCADIRGFTKLFYLSDQNLEQLTYVMDQIYSIMGTVISDFDGTKVQYQGDRIVAVFNDYNEQTDDSAIRMLEAAFTLNAEIQKLNEDFIIKDKLNNKNISIGIGCSFGNIIATRLGLINNKDNIVLSDAYERADKSEDEYSDANEIIIWKYLNDLIEKNAEETEKPQYLALDELFFSVSSSGYYRSSATYEEYQQILDQKRQLEDSTSSVFSANYLKDSRNQGERVQIRPWGYKL